MLNKETGIVAGKESSELTAESADKINELVNAALQGKGGSFSTDRIRDVVSKIVANSIERALGDIGKYRKETDDLKQEVSYLKRQLMKDDHTPKVPSHSVMPKTAPFLPAPYMSASAVTATNMKLIRPQSLRSQLYIHFTTNQVKSPIKRESRLKIEGKLSQKEITPRKRSNTQLLGRLFMETKSTVQKRRASTTTGRKVIVPQGSAIRNTNKKLRSDRKQSKVWK